MEQRLGLKPQNDLEGVLQDVHWAVGSFGYFPSYALGAVMAAQFYEALREAVPEVEQQIAGGDFSGLMGWLRRNVHSQGARVSAQELLKLATGKPLAATAALRYLEAKYLEPETAVGSAAA
jgi:carboxypeptidase Taq